jgi:putative MATE family efflux protein
MLYTVVLSFANIGLVFSLSFGYFGLPNLGIYGVPWGIGLATAIVNIALIWLWLGNRFSLKANWRESFNREKTRELLRIGLPSAIEQGIVQLGFLVFLALVAGYGTAPYAAYGIGVSLLTVSIVVGFGFSIAGATLVGQLLGAKQYEEARASGWRATVLAMISMTVFGALIAFNAETITRFMVDDDEVVKHTVNFIYILAAAHPLMAIELTLAGALRGAGDTRFPLISTMAGLVFGRIGMALLFIAMDLSVTWVYTAMAGDYVIKASLIMWRYRSGVWLK